MPPAKSGNLAYPDLLRRSPAQLGDVNPGPDGVTCTSSQLRSPAEAAAVSVGVVERSL